MFNTDYCSESRWQPADPIFQSMVVKPIILTCRYYDCYCQPNGDDDVAQPGRAVSTARQAWSRRYNRRICIATPA